MPGAGIGHVSESAMGTDTNEAVPSKPSKSKPVDHNSQSKGAHDPEDRGAASQRASRDAGRDRQLWRSGLGFSAWDRPPATG
jgi:hypothetical protein